MTSEEETSEEAEESAPKDDGDELFTQILEISKRKAEEAADEKRLQLQRDEVRKRLHFTNKRTKPEKLDQFEWFDTHYDYYKRMKARKAAAVQAIEDKKNFRWNKKPKFCEQTKLVVEEIDLKDSEDTYCDVEDAQGISVMNIKGEIVNSENYLSTLRSTLQSPKDRTNEDLNI